MSSEMIAIVGRLPQTVLTANPKIAQVLGVFTKLSELVNGAPSYAKVDDAGVMLWWCAPEYWIIGSVENKGGSKGKVVLRSSTKRIEDAEGIWWAMSRVTWEKAPDLRLLRHTPPSDEDEVAVVGERTREQRDAEGRKRAIDLDGETAITGPAAKKARTTASSKDKAPKDKVSRLFNMLSMYVSDYAQLRGGDFRPLLDQNGSERFDEPLTEDELDEVAYPFPFIYFKEEGDGGVLRGWSARFDAPNGKFFTVKDLVTAVARFGRCQWGEDGHVFFEGLRRVNVQTYIAVYGS